MDKIDNLFDNPMVRQAKANMTPEELQRLQEIGEQMFRGISYETNVVNEGNVINTLTPEMKEGLEHIKAQLQSGLHPSMLDDNEKTFMVQALGSEWYLKFGYVKEDLKEIVTCK